MLFHPHSSHTPFDASLNYFVGAFDIYDQEETKGVELSKYDPNSPKDREELIIKYCLDPEEQLSYRHRYKLMDALKCSLNIKSFNFHVFFEDNHDEYINMAWNEDEIDDPREFFEEIYRLASDKWKDDLHKASLEDPSTW
ncbi:hypothetical protein [Pseudomonas sp. LG1D9]|uniref:hypothetical protein n=1 Tax=Pseudomonas sp. LG1D9 TaxID=2083054 RepID=UPI000CF35995|nr:hypothetical protein [Pseudomonas sp. LG1D9]